MTISTICGLQKFEEVEDYGRCNREWLAANFGILPKGSPSDSTIHRMMKGISDEKMSVVAGKFACLLLELTTSTIAVDGKSMNGTKCDDLGRHLHNLTAFDTVNRIPLCTMNCSEKSNEITMWHSLLDACGRYVKGTLFTGDAMGCQTAIVKRIRDGEGHYLLGVKGNQRSLAEDIELTCRLKRPDETFQTTDAGHGKVVRRTCCTYTDLSLVERLPDWDGLGTVVRIESRTRTVKTNEVTSETRYYISDIKDSAEFFNREVRRHWMIENYLHWNLDNAFRQDRCVRLSTSASRNLDSIQKIAFCILSAYRMPDKKGADAGLTRKMRIAMLDKAVLSDLLGQEVRN